MLNVHGSGCTRVQVLFESFLESQDHPSTTMYSTSHDLWFLRGSTPSVIIGFFVEGQIDLCLRNHSLSFSRREDSLTGYGRGSSLNSVYTNKVRQSSYKITRTFKSSVVVVV